MALQLLSGNMAVAEAARLARVQVVAAYPITPQTTIIERLAELIGSGRLDADYITVESEHSAMAACVGASLAGARAFTATSSQGLALMHEVLHWAAGQRTPILMANVNRALGPPWNIWVEHTDSMSQRDTGWLQFYSETNQEALDATLLMQRVAEDARVQLPAMVMLDAFLLSHAYMPVDVPEPGDVDRFLPPFRPAQQVEAGAMQLFGSFSPPDLVYMELRHDIARASESAREAFAEARHDFEARFGRPFQGSIEEYRAEDAEAVLVAAGSLAATARDAVDELRRQGRRVGLARLRLFRPFPREEIQDLGRRVPAIGIVDRSYSFGGGGPIATEVRSALLDLPSPPRVASFVAGLGGRDVRPDHLGALLLRLAEGKTQREEWVGLKEAA